jgi:hypothetical protein
MTIEDKLADLTADLVECEENQAFLARLFALQAGAWADVVALCHEVIPLEEHVAHLQESTTGRLRVTWLDYPNAAHGKGYCLIIFFVEELHWSNVALYNKHWFLQKNAHQAGAIT